MILIINLCLIIFAYLLGSLCSAILVCRFLGYPDPRLEGSYNPGTTNVLRIAGKKAAAITLLGDSLKGFIPVLVAQLLGVGSTALNLIAIAAFLGHLFPLFFKFQGGKGVATAWGVLLALSWPVGIALLITWLIIIKLFRYSSLAALTAAIMAPIYTLLFNKPIDCWGVMIISLLLIIRHQNNIKRLFNGTEPKIGEKVT